MDDIDDNLTERTDLSEGDENASTTDARPNNNGNGTKNDRCGSNSSSTAAAAAIVAAPK